MSDEVIALIYNFLSDKDQTCAEIFKRGFELNLACVEDLPPLEEIVKFFIKSKKKKSEPSTLPNNDEVENIVAMAKSNPSDFLERIVKKRQTKSMIEDDTSTETEGC